MDKINFPYRSENHLPLLHVVAESGSWEEHGLDVNYKFFISSKDAHKNVGDGSVEFVSGNHTTPYADRARGGNWVYLGQTVDTLNLRLVATPESDISDVSDLKGKVIGTRGTHPTLNVWLYLKQHGLNEDNGDFKLVPAEGLSDMWHAVRDRKVDAAFVTPPADLFARRAGLKIIDVRPLPMIWLTTVSTSLSFVEKHPKIAARLLKGLLQGIAFFKKNREKAIKIIQEKYTEEGAIDREVSTYIYEELTKILLPNLYPSLAAIQNVYELALREDKAAKEIPPLALWDFHCLRVIDDSGFVDKLYNK